jgi:uncharacterized protein (DUF2147 family)
MKGTLRVAALVALQLAPLVAAPAAAETTVSRQHGVYGVWQNPSGSVHIRTARCGANVCGTVVYADDKARADAAKAGTSRLIGMNLFQDFRQTGPTSWAGKVLVPDLNRSVNGTITLEGPRTMDVDGCLFGHFACKDQKWTKIG